MAVLGVVFFVVYAGLCAPPAWRSPEPLVRYARLAWAIGGVGMVVYLIYAELFEIDAICLWCSLVHLDHDRPLRRRGRGGGARRRRVVRRPGRVISAPMTSPPTSTSRWWVLLMVLVLLAALALVVYVSK